MIHIRNDEILCFKPVPEDHYLAARRLSMNPLGPQADVRGADLGEVAEKILAVEVGQG